MTENTDTQNPDAAVPPAPSTSPPAAPEQPKTRLRDRKVGVVTLAASTVAALVIGGGLGTATGGLVGYGIGHHDRPDRPGIARMQWQDRSQSGVPGGGRPEQPQFQPPPNGDLPPQIPPEGSEGGSSGSDESSS